MKNSPRNTAISYFILIVLLLCGSMPLRGANTDGGSDREQVPVTVTAAAADRFKTLLVQTPQGRIEPMESYASELLRKLTHRDRYRGLAAERTLLSLLCYPQAWSREPMLYLPESSVRELLLTPQSAPSDRARIRKASAVCYRDLFAPDGRYLLQQAVERAYATPPDRRNKQDKALLKADEKLNILTELFCGRMLPLYPAQVSTQEESPLEKSASEKRPAARAAHTIRWVSPGDSLRGIAPEDSLFIIRSFGWYLGTLRGEEPQNLASATAPPSPSRSVTRPGVDSPRQEEEPLALIAAYQQARTAGWGPSPRQLRAEHLYNRADIFRTLFRGYLIAGFLLLLALFWRKTSPPTSLRLLRRALGAVILLLLVWHSVGIALRWYISGRAPWTNAYESMVYVSWTTLLAGMLFARRSPLTLALATLMGGVVLFVSNLNWLDPQITPLVPVLKSYWLMIHVSVITASYGFFGICTVTALVSLLRIAAGKPLGELRTINELAMQIGIVLLTAGIFLGAVWANESWGRYWGWDPKETWALITLLVYVFITHSRHLAVLRNDYAFSALSLVAIASVLMTFFGVNYYLSGLHSYGGSGQISPAPVIIGTGITAGILLLAGIGYRRNRARTKTLRP